LSSQVKRALIKSIENPQFTAKDLPGDLMKGGKKTFQSRE